MTPRPRRPPRPSQDPGPADTERPSDPPGDPEFVAREICLRLLAQQARSRAQLATALTRRGIPPDVVERVLSRFTDVGLINDRAFAETFVVARHRDRGLARRALSVELRRRGVDQTTVAEALTEIDSDTEEATARTLIRRRLPATRGLEPTARLRRLAGLLARKGYPPGLAYRVVREELAAEDPAAADDLPEEDFTLTGDDGVPEVET